MNVSDRLFWATLYSDKLIHKDYLVTVNTTTWMQVRYKNFGKVSLAKKSEKMFYNGKSTVSLC